MSFPFFTLSHEDPSSDARAGVVHTDHGDIQTPIFMPVGTVGTVKAVYREQLLQEINAPIILGNTYHLYLRPGNALMRALGGLHQMAAWPRALLTDSGGYQVFSLAGRRKLSEEGAQFQSHIDGSTHLFTPENVIDTQRVIGSDIMMVLDECPPGDATFDYAAKSHELTLRWAKRCHDRWQETDGLYGHRQALFGIVQGVVYPELRRASADALVALDFPGYAIGGLSVGEPAPVMYEMVEIVAPRLPKHKPRYLMGVGTPANLLENIARGVDMFDCVMPTRNGRNGMIFTTQGIINIRNKKWERDASAIDPGLENAIAQGYSKAYLRHLFVAKEILGLQLASVQNLAFYLWLMREARQAIVAGTYHTWMQRMLPVVSTRL